MRRIPGDRLHELLERFAAVRILVVGDAMLDVYLRGPAARISPEAPVPVVHVAEEWQALGGAANVAANIAALGARCGLVACVGNDTAGATLGKALESAGIDATLIDVPGRPTTVKTRVLTRHQQVARYDREMENDVDPGTAERVVAAVERAADGADAIALEDYDKGVLVPAVIDAALDAGRSGTVPVVADPKARRFFDYAGATVFKPNRTELAAALRAPIRLDAEWMHGTRRHLGCEHLLVTLGEDGMVLSTGADQFMAVPAVGRAVYDVSGAGDTVTAMVSVALAAGAEPWEAAVLATHAAGIEVGKPGVATVSTEELRQSFEAADRQAMQDSTREQGRP